MRARNALVASGATACALALVAAESVAADRDSDDPLSLTAVVQTHTDVNVGRPGFGAGDFYVETWSLRADGEQVGTGGGECQFLAVTPTSVTDHCDMHLRLAGGQLAGVLIDTAGPGGPPGVIVFAVTGGTGIYKSARGELVVQPGEDRFRIVLRLV